ncbi:MAG: hypothetical protein ACXVXS_12020, partial [Blastococcus sp.]
VELALGPGVGHLLHQYDDVHARAPTSTIGNTLARVRGRDRDVRSRVGSTVSACLPVLAATLVARLLPAGSNTANSSKHFSA